MIFVELIALLAVLQYLFFGFMTGQARRKSGLKAPATTGDESYERMYRVQVNTMEILIVFLPALFIAGKYWSPVFVSLIGLVFIVSEPSSRTLGFLMTMLPTLILVVLGIAGVVFSLFWAFTA